MSEERGQATVEWVGLVLLVVLALGAALSLGVRVDGRSFGGFLAHHLVCAMRGGCAQHNGDAALAATYGGRDAGLLRAHAPGLVYEPGERQLPVDFRRCRRRRCADAPADRDADVHRTHAGERATLFTRVVRRGGRTWLAYWLYFPDSNSAWMGSDRVWEKSVVAPAVRRVVAGDGSYPGYHRDDWEGYQVRLDPDGSVWARASSHGHYQGCKHKFCRNEWTAATGWTRVSRGSHAGHVPKDVYRRPRGLRPEVRREWPRLPGRDMRERTSTGESLRLVPLEPLRGKRRYRRLGKGVSPPWEKRSYRDPEDGSA